MHSFFYSLPKDANPDEIKFEQSSSNENVLNYSDTSNLILSTSNNVINVTSAFSFDQMVGETNYTLRALNKTTDEVLHSITVQFTIAGLSLFIEEPDGSITYVAGLGRQLNIPYKLLVNDTLPEGKVIRAFIQHPDGRTSDDHQFITAGSDLSTSPMTTNSIGTPYLFKHTTKNCTMDQLAAVNNDRFSETVGCGFGFYEDAAGKLHFGIDFNPYRVGQLAVHFTWPSLTADEPTLSGENFELSFHTRVTGKPPVVIIDYIPESGRLRAEGGEVVEVEVINADLHNITAFHIEVDNVSEPFQMIPASYEDLGAPTYTQNVSFVSESGAGSNLNWTLIYTVDSVVEGEVVSVDEDAICLPGDVHEFTFDETPLRIDSVTPSYGDEAGGEVITVTGYFPDFDSNRHGIFFSGSKLDNEYLESVSPGKIVFKLPPKATLGENYEYEIQVIMGNAKSNAGLFFFLVKDAEVHISHIGTSKYSADTFRVGSCTPARFTAIVSPYTRQIQSYAWTLYRVTDTTKANLLLSDPMTAVNTSAQTIEVLPEWLSLEFFNLHLKVTLLGGELATEIQLIREDLVNIGAFILDPPERAVYYPDTPLRLVAVVRPPTCYTGNQSMMFEWTAFGEIQQFSYYNTTGKTDEDHLTSTPARLGLEYVVPQENLSPGNHTVNFKVWMEHQQNVNGEATTQVSIYQSDLVAVIRQGEVQTTVNYQTTLHMYASLSYDPDVAGAEKYAGLTYEWGCRESTRQNYQQGIAEECNPALLVDSAATSFSVPMNIFESIDSIQVVEYSLVVKKGGNRVSKKETLVVYLEKRDTLPQFTDYSIILTNSEGTALDLDRVPYYEQLVLAIQGAASSTWNYELVEPGDSDFFSKSNLINSPLFYSPESSLFTVSGNTKPLGIDSWKLDPFTNYTIRIVFDRTSRHAATSVLVRFTTTEALIVGFPVPAVTNGTTETIFTATAGIPATRDVFSYFFILTDSEGYEFCIGGCTGYNIVHFQIGRAGNYSLRTFVFDMQGKGLLASADLPQNITVHETGNPRNFLTELDIMFLQGNDHCWTQFAHDLALMLLEPQLRSNFPTTRAIADKLEVGTVQREELLSTRMEYTSYITNGMKDIYCNTYPNSYHGRDCISLSLDIVRQKLLAEPAMYNTLQAVECCVQNAPVGTINKMENLFTQFLIEANRIAFDIYHGGNTRRRLLNDELTPAYIYADVQNWTSRNMFQSVTSGKGNGFFERTEVGTHGSTSFVVAKNAAQLPAKVVRGELRSFVGGPSTDEEFFPRSECLAGIFAEGNRRLYFVFQAIQNFVLYGFQDEPVGSNLNDKLYEARIYERDSESGKFKDISIPKGDYCFCYRLPVQRLNEFLNDSVDEMPGLYAVSEDRPYGVITTEKGEAYKYIYKESKTSDYNALGGWMEGCRYEVGMVGTTVVSKTGSNIIGDSGGRVLGTGGLVIVGIVCGVVLLVLVALVLSWMIAMRAIGDDEAALGAAGNELYVERDVYGRSTIFDANAARARSPAAQ